MTGERLTRHFILLRALRWLPLGLVLPFLVLTPVSRGLELGAVGAVFAVHSAVLIALDVPSGALADSLGRSRSRRAFWPSWHRWPHWERGARSPT